MDCKIANMTYNQLRNNIFSGTFRSIIQTKDEDIVINKIFKLDDKLEGRFLSSGRAICVPDNDAFDYTLTLDKFSNFKWRINYSSNNTRLTSSFFEGEINPQSHSVITVNTLKIIGKSITLKYKQNENEKTSQCVIYEELDITPTTKDKPEINHSIKALIVAIMIVMVIILFALVALLRKKKKTQSEGFRVVDLSTSVASQIF
jgi:hypothetical protein